MLAAVSLLGLPGAGPGPRDNADTAPSGLTRMEVAFDVVNTSDPATPATIHGFRIDPSCPAATVVLLQHGLSYTGEAWDHPDLSFARRIAAAGYSVVAIDRLGYGRSVLADGYRVSTLAYHHMTHQIVTRLRQEFAHVVVGGHSAGAEASEGAVATYGSADALLALGYHHYPAPELVQEFVTGDIVRAAGDDYEYFLATPEQRRAWFYDGDFDPAVADADTAAAVLTPSGEILSGEILSIGPQPSRYVAPAVDVPVFLQLAELDRLFPVEYAAQAAATFAASPSVTVDVVPDAGHTYMLHRSGPAAADRLAAWLGSRPETPACATGS